MFADLRQRLPRPSAASVDWLIASGLAAVTLWHVWVRGDVSGPLWLRVTLPLLLDLPLLGRRRAPLGSFAVISAAVILQALLGQQAAAGLELVGPVAVAAYSVARYADRRRALAGLALFVVAAADNDARSHGISTTAEIWADAFWSLAQLAIWLAGRFFRARSEQQRLALRTETLEREAQGAAAEERARIARELHDIVSHTLSVVVTQAAGARAIATTGKAAPESLERIEESARQALVEMRRLLGVLREDEGEAAVALAPQPGVADLPALVESLQRSGIAVDIRVDPGCRALPPALDLSVYRIVQEALTNVLKHARASHALVAVDRGAAGITVEVADDGVGSSGRIAGGHGLVGMRERAAIFGGSMATSPRVDGNGFLVRVELPLLTT
jgi:signal transduction histidine kinase